MGVEVEVVDGIDGGGLVEELGQAKGEASDATAKGGELLVPFVSVDGVPKNADLPNIEPPAANALPGADLGYPSPTPDADLTEKEEAEPLSFDGPVTKGESGLGVNDGVTDRIEEDFLRTGKSAAAAVIGDGGTRGVSAVVGTTPSMYSA